MNKIPIAQILNGSLDCLITLSNVADKLIRAHAQCKKHDDIAYGVTYMYSERLIFPDMKTVEAELLRVITYRYEMNQDLELHGWLHWVDNVSNESKFYLSFSFYNYVCRFSLPELGDSIVNPFSTIYDIRKPIESILEEYSSAVKFHLKNQI